MKAMVDVRHSTHFVRFQEERCTGCAACLRVCPTKAIRIRQQKSIRIVNQCIGCGACIRACSAGAVSAATIGFEGIGRDHVAIALVSPVLYAQFPGVTPGGVLLGLHRMGFRHTVDMSFFLEMFQYAAEEFIRRNRLSPVSPWPLISPICPVVVRLIAFQFPSLLPHVLPVLRPVALMAREVKKQILPAHTSQGRQVTLYFINPCPTKAEIRSDGRGAPPEHREAAIGINDLYAELKRQVDQILDSDLIPYSGSGYEFETCSSGNAALGAMSGGEISNMEIEKSLSVHGLQETIAYLHKIEMGVLKDFEYIEFRTCREGCLGGVLTAVDPYIAKRNVQKMIGVFGLGRRLPRDTILRLYEKGRFQPDQNPQVLTRLFGACKPALSLEEAQQIEAILDLIEGRDCGACGSPDCLTFAEDVVRGNAALTDCIWLQARQQKKILTPLDTPANDGRGEK
jgi:Na+-translocating ferredoxin:NAD+ oxidoreductase RNF subunit RnfB